jgi:cbb3-type cytochrome oxidase maturation protein
MTVLYVLITASSIVAGIFLIAFIWSVKSGQFDDSYTPSVRALFDDNKPEEPESENIKTSNN